MFHGSSNLNVCLPLMHTFDMFCMSCHGYHYVQDLYSASFKNERMCMHEYPSLHVLAPVEIMQGVF